MQSRTSLRCVNMYYVSLKSLTVIRASNSCKCTVVSDSAMVTLMFKHCVSRLVALETAWPSLLPVPQTLWLAKEPLRATPP